MTPTLVLAGGLLFVGQAIPADWHGDWSGTLSTPAVHDTPAHAMPMILTVRPVAARRLTWTVEKGEGVHKEKARCELVTDGKPAHFVLIEEGGPRLVATFDGVRLTLLYTSVRGSSRTPEMTIERYERTAEGIRYDVGRTDPWRQGFSTSSWRTGGEYTSHVVAKNYRADLKRRAEK